MDPEANVESQKLGTEIKTKTEDQKYVEDNFDDLIAQNVIKDDSNIKVPEADGLLVDGSLLKNINEWESKPEDDILADMEGANKKGKRRSKKKGSARNSKKSRSRKGAEDEVLSSS